MSLGKVIFGTRITEPKLNNPMSELKTPFKVGETYKTRGGWDAKVIYIRKSSELLPVIAIHFRGDEEHPETHTSLGSRFTNSTTADKYDLIPPAPPMKRVPLTPADVPPGSVVSDRQHAPEMDCELVLRWMPDTFGTRANNVGWARACKDGWQVKVPGGEWQPMWKEVPDDSTNA